MHSQHSCFNILPFLSSNILKRLNSGSKALIVLMGAFLCVIARRD